MRYGVFGTFDNLNPVIVRGVLTTARGIWFDKEFGNLVFEPLMQRSMTSPSPCTACLPRRSRPRRAHLRRVPARSGSEVSDGNQSRPEDVLFTVEMLREHGRPIYPTGCARRSRSRKSASTACASPSTTRPTAKPLISGRRSCRNTPSTEDLRADDAEAGDRLRPLCDRQGRPGQRIVYRRNPDYWGKDLPVKQGFDNYETSRSNISATPTRSSRLSEGLTHIYLEGTEPLAHRL